MDTDIYKLVTDNSVLCELEDKRFILDHNTETSIGKLIYKIADFDAKKKNIDINNYFIEVCVETPNTNMMFASDNKKKQPALSSITFLSDEVSTFIFTQIDIETYKYKQFDDDNLQKNTATIVFSEKYKHVIFNNTYMFGLVELLGKTKVLRINLWEQNPNIEYYVPQCSDEIQTNIDIIENSSNKMITIKKILTYDFYNNLIYRKDMKCFNFFKLMLDDGDIDKTGEILLLDTYNKKEEEEEKLREKYGNVFDDFTEIKNLDNDIVVKQNRFFQRTILPNVLCSETTKWIVNECISNPTLWTNTHEIKYSSFEITNENNNCILNFLIKMVPSILKKIQTTYDMPINSSFNVSNIYIFKQDQSMDFGITMKRNNSFFNIIIGLNDSLEYEGGEVVFNDGLSSSIGNGQILIYSRAYNPTFLKITVGTKFFLMLSVDC